MKTMPNMLGGTRLISSLAAILILLGGLYATHAQAQWPPNDLLSITASQIPDTCGGLYSMAHPDWPPLPPDCAAIYPYQLYYSPSLGLNTIFMDDRGAPEGMMAADEFLPPGGDDGGGDTNAVPDGGFTPLVDFSVYGTNLFMELSSAGQASQGWANIVLHNTSSNTLYAIVSHEVVSDGLSCSNWPVETFVWGATDSTNTPTTVLMGNRTNLFFWAYSVPASNAVAMARLGDSATNCWAIINGTRPTNGQRSTIPSWPLARLFIA